MKNESQFFSDIHPVLLNNKALFFGIETGNVGDVETIYENGAFYTVVANEKDDGFHYEHSETEN